MEANFVKISVKGRVIKVPSVQNGTRTIIVSGRFPRIARLKAEYYEWVDDPYDFLAKVKADRVRADLFTFLQKVGDRNTHYNFYSELDSVAVLRITTYEDWWTRQINDKTRNMIRKAEKKGIEIRVIEFNDSLIKGIKEIYDESPLRQGKPFKHYGKDLANLRNDHISFLDHSQFIGAFYKDELVGFVKMVRGEGIYHLMQIISRIEHRSKAPTNALIAKAVEICAEESVPYLHYGIWSRRGLGDFKKHHAFERYDLLRYFIPLNLKGNLILKLALHRKIAEQLPESWKEFLIKLRAKWYSHKHRAGRV